MQEGSFVEIDTVAKRLSLELHCALRLPERDRTILVCSHGVAFSISRLQGSSDWSWAKEEHSKAEGGQT